MPRGDQTGPMGVGAMTGRGMGNCESAIGLACRRSRMGRRAQMQQGPRRGSMQGPGRGYGRGMDLAEQEECQDPKEFLQERKEFLEERLELINDQLEKL